MELIPDFEAFSAQEGLGPIDSVAIQERSPVLVLHVGREADHREPVGSACWHLLELGQGVQERGAFGPQKWTSTTLPRWSASRKTLPCRVVTVKSAAIAPIFVSVTFGPW